MPWLKALYDTYESVISSGYNEREDVSEHLTPIAHITATAQIEVHLDRNGEFKFAEILEKPKKKNAKNGDSSEEDVVDFTTTIIPVTEDSAVRSSAEVPHPLCDTLPYVAGDFAEYCTDEKDVEKSKKKFEAYSEQLKGWAESEYSHSKVRAIYSYISKKRMIADLVECGKIKLDEKGKFDGTKISGQPYDKVLVRFSVKESATDNGNVWEDSALFDSFIRFYLAKKDSMQDICYLTGEKVPISTKHPRGIIASSYGAKLISANDTTNFVYRGRFKTDDEAFSLGYEASQKAHAALKWLAKNQGITVGQSDKRTFICWNPCGKPVQSPNEFPDDFESNPDPTEQGWKLRLRKAIKGYTDDLSDNDNIVIIALEAATTGRLSITYYNELNASDYYDRLQAWEESCFWEFQWRKDDGKTRRVVHSPSPYSIVKYAFGSGEKSEISDKVLKEQYQRIIHCKLDIKPIPYDMVHALFVKVSNPQCYQKQHWIYENILSTACAVIAKYYKDKGVEISMALDYENKDRSYLFGRLLAVAEAVERSALTKSEEREPNALKLQSAFVNHPLSTWKTLEGMLAPYYRRLSTGLNIYYKKIATEIIDDIYGDGDREKLNRPLGDMYIFGYYSQRAELYKQKNKTNKTNETENQEEN